MSLEPHAYWQHLDAPGTHAQTPETIYTDSYPATLPDGRQLVLPIRVLPGDGSRAVASLIVNQASFAVEDALAEVMAEQWRSADPDVVVGVPTLGLPLANAIARRLGHARMVALGTSRKFWYDEELSEPIRSITSPDKGKSIYLDPRMVALLEGRKVLVVDDVVSTGTSLAAVLRLLAKAKIKPVGISVAMEQSERWRECLSSDLVGGALKTPLLRRCREGFVEMASAPS
ncbi:MAG: phosphoribosyltransferase [Idiomarina sp.]|nr:phosphoribosyltransferase [Idiomarina sp.]